MYTQNVNLKLVVLLQQEYKDYKKFHNTVYKKDLNLIVIENSYRSIVEYDLKINQTK